VALEHEAELSLTAQGLELSLKRSSQILVLDACQQVVRRRHW